jgi:hypothetical protein
MNHLATTRRVKAELDLAPLRAFGDEANRLELPCIADGGFIVPGREPAINAIPGKEERQHDQGTQARPEVGREAGASPGATPGPREGTSSEAAAASSPAHAVGIVSVVDVLEELGDNGIRAAVAHSSSYFVCIQFRVGLFRTLPFRAELLLEVPLVERSELRRGLSRLHPVVPDVRAWAKWSTGKFAGKLIRTHHEYPDQSMCVCMPNQWALGRQPLVWYIDFCVVWIGKALYEQEFESYPGLQHYPELVRVKRDRQQEYCGCGSTQQYARCCRDSDRALSLGERIRRHRYAENAYLAELESMGRSRRPPSFLSDSQRAVAHRQ